MKTVEDYIKDFEWSGDEEVRAREAAILESLPSIDLQDYPAQQYPSIKDQLAAFGRANSLHNAYKLYLVDPSAWPLSQYIDSKDLDAQALDELVLMYYEIRRDIDHRNERDREQLLAKVGITVFVVAAIAVALLLLDKYLW